MTLSIMSNKRECFVCGYTRGLHRHHVFYGLGRREMSEHFGCWCYLCGRHHNMDTKYGVHFNKELDKRLKRECQRLFEQTHTRDEFHRYFGSSYLTEDDDDKES